MTLMNNVFHDLLDKFVIIYLDDILVYSKNASEHQDHLRQVLLLLRKHQLFGKLSKCDFGKKSVDFLGHTVSDQGLAVDPHKIDSIRTWPAPTNQTELRSFLGLATYYRRFISHFATITAPMTDLLKKDQEYNWSSEAAAAFSTIKMALTTTPVLLLPDQSKPFRVTTDASDYAIGAVLSQDQGHGDQPIAFESRKMTPAELNYPIHEKELLAIIHALKIWRIYLEGHPFEVITDHASLEYLHTQAKLSRRQARWLETLQAHDFIIRYRPEKTNVIADALTRKREFNQVVSRLALELPQERLQESYLQDDYLHPLYQALNDPTTDSPPSLARYFLDNGRLYLKTASAPRLCIGQDADLRLQLLHDHYNISIFGHLGTDKTYSSLSRDFYWRKMQDDVKRYIASCESCQRNKSTNRAAAGLLNPLPTPTNR